MEAIGLAKDVGALIPALERSEAEKRDLETEIARLQHSKQNNIRIPSREEVGQLLAEFLLRFRQVFSAASMEERKLFVRQWIERIEVYEREGKKKATAWIRTLPRIPEFDALWKETVFSGPCRTSSCSGITQKLRKNPLLREIEVEI